MTRTCILPGLPESARAAREFTAACLTGWPGADDAVLCVDELFVNAVRHSRSGRPGGTVTIRLTAGPGAGLRVEVQDAGPLPRLVPAQRRDALAESGRGLALVEALADTFGADAARGLHWFAMTWRRPEASAQRTPAELAAERARGICECSGQCGRAGHRCAIGSAPGHPLHIVAAGLVAGDTAAARLPAGELIALCAACRAGRDRIAARAAAGPELAGLFDPVVTS